MNRKRLFGEEWIFDGFLPGEKKTFLSGFAVKRLLYQGKSAFQTFHVFDTAGFGRIFFLDGLVQLSTAHEHVYHEMLVHPALLSHPHARRVLIVGGGDGGALREVLKHPVKEAVLVDIDKKVIEVSKKYLSSVNAGAFSSKRSTVIIGDGIEFVSKNKNAFDCIILDSNDPDGVMAQKLFQERFFRSVRAALKKGGIFAAQTGYVSDGFGKKARSSMKKVFGKYALHVAFVPHFPRDLHSFPVASVSVDPVKIPEHILQKRYEVRRLSTSYYSPALHGASRVLAKKP